jgi:hypothetical protein
MSFKKKRSLRPKRSSGKKDDVMLSKRFISKYDLIPLKLFESQSTLPLAIPMKRPGKSAMARLLENGLRL